jgi:hypothetical protein
MTRSTHRRNMAGVKPHTSKWAAITIATESWPRTIRLCVIVLVVGLCPVGSALAASYLLLR